MYCVVLTSSVRKPSESQQVHAQSEMIVDSSNSLCLHSIILHNRDDDRDGVVVASHCESSPCSFDECRRSATYPPASHRTQPTWAVSLPVGRYHPSPPSPFIITPAHRLWCVYILYMTCMLSAECRVVAHIECRDLSPLPCIPAPVTPTKNPSAVCLRFHAVNNNNNNDKHICIVSWGHDCAIGIVWTGWHIFSC